MKAVLDQLAALHPKPLEKLSPAQARLQPTAADAVRALLKKQGKSTAPEAVASAVNKTIPAPERKIRVRVYTPAGNGPMPALVYLHGGGWVLGSIQDYEASARALANAAKCKVLSVSYRYAPEHPFPAAHEDAYAVTQWVLKHGHFWGIDQNRVAVGGESAGGNLAAAVCLMARNRGAKMPVHQLLVYPVTGHDFYTPSYEQNAHARPLNRAMMMWFFLHETRRPDNVRNPYLVPLRAHNLQNLPPATVITAEIDPLHSEGEAYATRLRQAGVPVSYRLFRGVTHEFFGMGAVVDKAKQAVAFAAEGLRTSFEREL